MADNGTTSINFKLWTPTGVEVLFHLIPTEIGLALPTNGPDAVIFGQQTAALLASLLNGGWLARCPTAEEKRVEIVTVMRRQKADGTPIIDFYPEWKGEFGMYKTVHVYMDNDRLKTEFLAASGFQSLDSIPLYDGQGPLKRTPGKPHPKETAVPKPFLVVCEQGEEKVGSDGKPYRPWELVRYETGTPAAMPISQPPAENGDRQIPDWWEAATHNADLYAAFGDQRGNVLRDLLTTGKVTMTTPIEDVVKAALATNTDEVPF